MTHQLLPVMAGRAMQVLLLAWKMRASRMGYFSRQEFTTGLKLLNAPSLDKLRKVKPANKVFLHTACIQHGFRWRDI